MEFSNHPSLAVDQQLFTLGEFYVKKGNFPLAREVFSRLIQQSKPTSHMFHFLGKTELELGNLDLALTHLEKARLMNPFYKPTLLLLLQIHEQREQFSQSLECLVDLFLLSKEMADPRADKYKKRIRSMVKKISPPMSTAQKNLLIKERNHYLNQHLSLLEKSFTAKTEDAEHAMHDFDPTMDPPDTAQVLSEEAMEFDGPTFREYDTHSLDESLTAEIDEHIAKETKMEEAGENPQTSNVISHPFIEKRIVIEELQHILFRSLSPSMLEKIQKFSSVHRYQKDEVIHQPLDLIYGFSCVLEGKVQVLHQDVPLIQLEAGSIIDEAELCNGTKYFFESRAVEPATILIVDKPALLTLCKNHHELGYHFLWHFYKSLSLKINAVFDNVIYQNPTQGVIWSLDLLQEISQQRQVTPLEVHTLERLFQKIELNKNDFLFKNHAHADTFYILLDGEITLEHPQSGDTIQLSSMEYFSEICLISNSFEHAMNAKVISNKAILLSIDRTQLSRLYNHDEHDNYRLAEILWKIFSGKYFEFLNFYYHLIKSSASS